MNPIEKQSEATNDGGSHKGWTVAQIRELDRLAVEEFGMRVIVLMENAGRSVAEVIRAQNPNGKIICLCGKGKNGGDGLVAARVLDGYGLTTEIWLVDPIPTTIETSENLEIARKAGMRVIVPNGPITEDELNSKWRGAEWIVDGLLGIGVQGDPREPIATWIRAANRSHVKRLAIDVPSGLNADSGMPGNPTFRADVTVTLVGPKVGFQLADANDWLGRVVVASVGASQSLMDRALALMDRALAD